MKHTPRHHEEHRSMASHEREFQAPNDVWRLNVSPRESPDLYEGIYFKRHGRLGMPTCGVERAAVIITRNLTKKLKDIPKGYGIYVEGIFARWAVAVILSAVARYDRKYLVDERGRPMRLPDPIVPSYTLI